MDMQKVKLMPRFNLNIPKMGDIIAYENTSGMVGKAIEKVQRKKGFTDDEARYTHVDISLGGQHAMYVGPPFSRLIDIRKKHPRRFCKILRYRGYDKPRKSAKVAAWAASHCNLVYDFSGVVSFLFKFVKDAKHLYFCSENALWALQKEYPKALGLRPDKCMPAHFVSGKEFIVIWEGRLPHVR